MYFQALQKQPADGAGTTIGCDKIKLATTLLLLRGTFDPPEAGASDLQLTVLIRNFYLGTRQGL
jgi:hypothetical protein